MDIKFITSVASPSQLPEENLIEIPFIGRSNCGKSTLINSLLNHNKLAKTSKSPGATKMINFFSFDDKHLIVDLPGYGFSATSSKLRENWQFLVEKYIERSVIKMFLFLMDIRRDLKKEDFVILKYLSTKKPIYLILTKSDKLSKEKNKLKLELIKKQIKQIPIDKYFITSSLKKTGIDNLKNEIFSL